MHLNHEVVQLILQLLDQQCLAPILKYFQHYQCVISLFPPAFLHEYLKAGDTIAIVAPSGILNDHQNYIDKAKNLLESWNLNVLIGENIYNNYGHFSGTDKERAQDFQRALDDKTISAIWCARGGYGAMRIIDNLDYSEYIKNPKWIIGYLSLIHI